MFLYSLALLLVLTLTAPVWGWRMLRQGRYRQGLPERLGRVPRHVVESIAGRPVVWLHAVSVGETLAAARLVRELTAALPDHVVVVSTTTPTGHQVARERFGADRVFFYPLDFRFAVRAYLAALRPALVVLMESELWPRMLHECARQAVPVVVVNARMSDRSLPRYRLLRPVWRPLLAKITLLLTQTPVDAERWSSIGVPAERIRVTGNLKYDIANPADSPLAQLLRKYLPPGMRVLVAGSTHPGEEELLLRCFAGAMRRIDVPPGVLLLAPRHPKRSSEVLAIATAEGLCATLLSAWRSDPHLLQPNEVLVVDTVGELASLYSLASGAFLGGSLVDHGGHNPLEPAQFRVPIAMGPHYRNFRAMVDALRARGAIAIVDSGELAAWIHDCLLQTAAVLATGQRAHEFYCSQSGATERTLQSLLPLVRGAKL